MSHRLKLLVTPVLAIILVATGFAFQVSTALAYGAADQPLAQIESSINCNDPDNAFCEGDAGGGWFWFEIDANGTGDIAGAFCGHTVGGVDEPGGTGAIPVRQEISWKYSNLSDGVAGGAEFFAEDPNDSYYLIIIEVGGEVEKALFPTTIGHYSYHPAPGIVSELQVAP